MSARLCAGPFVMLAAAAMTASLAVSPAFAQAYVFDYDLIITGFGRDDTSAHLSFEYKECSDFCIVVEFDCDRNGFTATMNYFDSVEMANWLTLQGGVWPDVTAIHLTLIRGGTEDEIPIEIIEFGDGPQVYSVTGMARRVQAAWYAPFATGDLAIATPSRTLQLPGTPADLAERAAFADACSTLAAR
ncbi:MAG: hypothetical protein KIS68_16080 [Bauldia sp.]|nr:hypothetical protein [Bauldia sp.]